MPNLFVVTDQKDVSAVARSVLTSRASAATRSAAVEAIRRANPQLDLESLQPGTVVIVPRVTGLKARAEDPVGDVTGDLAERVREGLEALVSAAQAGEEQRVTEKKEAQEVLGSASVKRLAASSPELEENVASVRATFKQDDAEAKRQLAAMDAAAQRWAADLEALRGLL